MENFIVGLDIGSSKICGTVGKINRDGNIDIIAVASSECTGVRKAIVVDIEETSKTIEKCISQLETMIDDEIDEVYISITGGICDIVNNRAVIAVSSDDKEIKESDVERVLEAAKLINISNDKEIIGINPVQYIVDGYSNVKDPVGMAGIRLEVEAQIILVNSTIITNMMKSISRADLQVLGIVLQPYATSEAVMEKEEKFLGSALIDVGYEKIDIAVFKNGNIVYSSMIPLGGSNITNDISACLNIPISEAERLKIKYGSVIIKDNDKDEIINLSNSYNSSEKINYHLLTEIIAARTEEILTFIKEKLIESENYEGITNIVIVGGGISLLKGINVLGKEVFNKPVRVGIPKDVGAAIPTYAASVGIVKDVGESLKKNVLLHDKNNDKRKWMSNNSNKKVNKITNKVKKFFTEFF